MDFMSKHIPFRKKRDAAMRLFSNGKLRGNSLQTGESLKPKTVADRSQSYDHTGLTHRHHHHLHLQQQQQQEQQFPRTVSYTHWKHFNNGDITENDNVWTIEDQIYYNVEKQILKAKAEARTVSVVDGDLYIDYQYICPLPYGLRV